MNRLFLIVDLLAIDSTITWREFRGAGHDFFQADEISIGFRHFGATVVGPVGSVSGAMEAMAGHEVDLAVLDIRLVGELCFDVADALRVKGTPFVFSTGYDKRVVPDRFAGVPLVSKPTSPTEIAVELNREKHRLEERARSEKSTRVGEFRYALSESTDGCNWYVTSPTGAFVAGGKCTSSLSARADALRFLLKRSKRTMAN